MVSTARASTFLSLKRGQHAQTCEPHMGSMCVVRPFEQIVDGSIIQMKRLDRPICTTLGRIWCFVY